MTKPDPDKKRGRSLSVASPNAHMFREQPGDDYPTTLGSVLRQKLYEARSLEVNSGEATSSQSERQAAPHMNWKQYTKTKKS